MDALIQGQAWRFDRFLLDLSNGGLFRLGEDGAREPVVIGSRALELLVMLVSRPGELMAKQTLIDAVWPGVAVEEKNLTVQISTLRRVLDQGRTGESCIQTVPGRGYRLAVPTSRVDLTTELVSSPMALPLGQGPVSLPVSHWSMALLLGLLAIVLTAGSMQLAQHLASRTTPPRLSVVVLPFSNLSGDRAEDYLADAVTDDLTTDLSRVPGTFVIARQSAYTYQGKTVDARQLGQELGVRYVLEGSVRKLGDELRVNAQLVATETGAHLWADHFDERLEGLSSGQNRIIQRIGETLRVALLDVESVRSRRERPTNPDVFDLILRARSIGLHVMGWQKHAERLGLFEEALRLDPTSLPAMTGVAGELIRRAMNAEVGDRSIKGESDAGQPGISGESGEGSKRRGDLRRAARLLTDAAAINPNHSSVLEDTAFLLFAQGRYSEAIAAYQRLLDEYPNSNSAYNQIGISLTFVGRAQDAIPMIETAIRRDPRSPYLYSRYEMLGYALLMLGRNEEAIAWTQRALAASPADYVVSHAQLNLRLAAAYVGLGRLEEARRAVAEAHRLWPYDTVRMHWPDNPSSPVYVAQIERFQSALRVAGHRDHAEEDADFGVASDDALHEDLAGPTPMTLPGAKTIRTAQLTKLLAERIPTARKPIIIDPMMYSWGRSIPGAVGLRNAGGGSPRSDAVEVRLRRRMQDLTGGDLSTAVVVSGFNSERFDGRNLALRLVALGYTDVYWYRGGREAWEVAELPETEADMRDW